MAADWWRLLQNNRQGFPRGQNLKFRTPEQKSALGLKKVSFRASWGSGPVKPTDYKGPNCFIFIHDPSTKVLSKRFRPIFLWFAWTPNRSWSPCLRDAEVALRAATKHPGPWFSCWPWFSHGLDLVLIFLTSSLMYCFLTNILDYNPHLQGGGSGGGGEISVELKFFG